VGLDGGVGLVSIKGEVGGQEEAWAQKEGVGGGDELEVAEDEGLAEGLVLPAGAPVRGGMRGPEEEAIPA
jgi:hypothetical protein